MITMVLASIVGGVGLLMVLALIKSRPEKPASETPSTTAPSATPRRPSSSTNWVAEILVWGFIILIATLLVLGAVKLVMVIRAEIASSPTGVIKEFRVVQTIQAPPAPDWSEVVVLRGREFRFRPEADILIRDIREREWKGSPNGMSWIGTAGPEFKFQSALNKPVKVRIEVR